MKGFIILHFKSGGRFAIMANGAFWSKILTATAHTHRLPYLQCLNT